MHYPLKIVENILQKTKTMHLEGFVEGSGPLFPQVMLIGEAPGQQEIKENIPFCGKSGKQLTNSLESIGLTRKDVYITSTVRSRPYSIKKIRGKQNQEYIEKTIYPNRKPTLSEQLIFSPILDWEIKTYQPHLIITLGNVSLQRLLGKNFGISNVHGQLLKVPIQKLDWNQKKYIYTEEEYLVIPLYHPAAIFYNAKLKEIISNDWKKVGYFLKTNNFYKGEEK
ncbi:uracil-DNA glycosylase [Lactococcus petauri]|uniref:uracil-DNA glycosylase n=1 Tax=Lactococcus petauri TaxID=1940789 RepID=UPI0038553B93